MSDLSFERCSELFSYCPSTGQLNWKQLINKRANPIICVSVKGYVVVSVDGRQYKVHRIIWTLQTGAPPVGPVDHADRDRINNRFENLRHCTRSQNAQNRKVHKNSICQAKGIRRRSPGGSFSVRITSDGHAHYLGSFATLDEALEVRRATAAELHGEFAS